MLEKVFPALFLNRAACFAIEHSLCVQKGETVLIVSNPTKKVEPIAKALYRAVEKVGASPTLVFQPVKSSLDSAEPALVAALKSEPNIIISISHNKMGKDRAAIAKPYQYKGKEIDSTFHYLMASKKSRSFWSPGISVASFVRTVPVDLIRMKLECKKIKEVLDKAEAVEISTKKGTYITIGLKKRIAFCDDGDFSAPGSGGNLPAGETFISPELGTSCGKIVFDGSMSVAQGTVKIKKPIICHVENGQVIAISGGKEAGILFNTINDAEEMAIQYEEQGKLPKGSGDIYRRNCRNLGELGIGINPNASIIGNMLVDEKAYCTCHIAIGSNYDEDAPSLIHLDGVIRKPTIIAYMPKDEKIIIMKEGKLVK